MESFGQKLRRERESREKPLEEIAGTTKIRLRFLEALETDEFDELPGPAFGKFFIRAYAEVLDLDPEPLIAEYEQEQQRRAREDSPEIAEEPEPKPSARLRWKARTEAARKKAEPPEATEITVEAESSPEIPAEASADREPEITTAPEMQPEPVIEEPQPLEAVEPVEDVTPIVERAVETSTAHRRPKVSPAGAAVGVVIVIVWLIAVLTSPGKSVDERAVNVAAIEAQETPVVRDAAATDTIVETKTEPAAAEPEPESVAPPPEPEPRRSPPSDDLTVEAFGVGTDVVNRRLIGESDRFTEGASVAFWTRVIGGGSGETVRHVWLRQGKVVQTVDLRVGGPHWRTHSRKTLWGVGDWAVEARGADGRVLARATFVCTPRGS